MNELISLYRDILSSLAYDVNDKGDIYVNIDGNGKRASIDELPLVLPTRDHLNSVTSINDAGKIVKCKTIFNPLKESAIADTESIVWLRTEIMTCINQFAGTAVQYLLRLLVDSENKKNAGEYTTDFLIYVGNKTDKKYKIDDGTFTKWDQIYANSFDPETGSDSLVSLVTHRRTKINEGNYTAYAKLNVNILDEINKNLEDNNPVIYKLKCKRDEMRVFKLILDYLFNTDKTKYPLTYETEVVNAPLTTALLELYNSVTKIPYNIIKELYKLQESFAFGIPMLEDGRRKQLVSRATIDAIQNATKLAEDIIDSNEKKVTKAPVLAAIDPNKGKVMNPEQNVVKLQQPQPVQNVQPVQQTTYQPVVTSPQTQMDQRPAASEESDLDRIKRFLAPTNGGLFIPPPQQIPVVPMQQVYVAPQPQPVFPQVQPQFIPQQQPMQQYVVGGYSNGFNQVPAYVQQQPSIPYYNDPFRANQGRPQGIQGNPGFSPLM